jgi:hypothetical protein
MRMEEMKTGDGDRQGKVGPERRECQGLHDVKGGKERERMGSASGSAKD